MQGLGDRIGWEAALVAGQGTGRCGERELLPRGPKSLYPITLEKWGTLAVSHTHWGGAGGVKKSKEQIKSPRQNIYKLMMTGTVSPSN